MKISNNDIAQPNCNTQIRLTINGEEISCDSSLNIIEACKLAKVEIPHFCYHPKLSIAGNCRMCLVEIEGCNKPTISCGTKVSQGMVIKTNTAKIKEARNGVMEMLLINHPLDCPVCDEGGECDLQDQAFYYSACKSNYNYEKRVVSQKYMGPYIKTHMTRCIHCTRCVRFSQEVTERQEIFAIGRGEDTEITTFEQPLLSRLSGNVIDLCPVGALTAYPYAYKYRKWELDKYPSYDIMDPLCSPINVYIRKTDNVEYRSIMRILPRDLEYNNWISDKARFCFDSLENNRLDAYYKANGISSSDVMQNNKFNCQSHYSKIAASDAIDYIVSKVQQYEPEEIGFLFGPLVDCETIYAYKRLAATIGTPYCDANIEDIHLTPYTNSFHDGIHGLESCDALIIAGADVDFISPVMHATIRQRVRLGEISQVYIVGTPLQDPRYGYAFKHMGDDIEALHIAIDALSNCSKPMVIVGRGAAQIPGLLNYIESLVLKFRSSTHNWHCINVIHDNVSATGSIAAGAWNWNSASVVSRLKQNKIKLLYSIGGHDLSHLELNNVEVIHQGHHLGNYGDNIPALLLPTLAHFEKYASYIDLKSQYLRTEPIINAKGYSVYDFEVCIHLLGKLHANPFSALGLDLDLEYENYMGDGMPLKRYDYLYHCVKQAMLKHNLAQKPCSDKQTQVESYSIGNKTSLSYSSRLSYFDTNPISRFSKILREGM